ncbi:hypothetical protein A4D02_35725 [Niastella koreensis]|uniref:Uncharacterized protein n=2 Tax=Niastella koreensis TaxID=354356 RepID=G8THN0_NIAKG|nr:hypothetical protein [Niastella koreensis]AEV97458.1 hypothetical protein Niako_1082 [Niastella koreensis GR20-10]OQP44159.1 hypothetical protein A4D02_35725 [Niastella koreensis]
MKWDVTILSTDEYLLEEICTEIIPDKYWLNDRGEYLITGNTLDSEATIYLLIDFIFQGNGPVTEIYRIENSYVLDLSALRPHLVDFDYLEKFYPRWLKRSRRQNTMSEYGRLLDFVGYARKGLDRKYLLMVVYCRQE